MAFAWPRPDAPPVVFDQASSVVARGEIQLHLRDARPVPPGWGIDAEGRPSTDPAAILSGAQLPFGGHKGSAIAMMVELMTGGLTAGPLAFEQRERDDSDSRTAEGGETLLVIDPAHFAPRGNAQAAIEHADRLFARLLTQDGARLPSDRRYAARAHSLEYGVSVPNALFNRVSALGAG
jgi:LDH2 family malate/lactate/ureidoglycolate dehydrogenase